MYYMYLPTQAFILLLNRLNSQAAYLYLCISGKLVGKFTCPTQKSTCPGQLTGHFLK